MEPIFFFLIAAFVLIGCIHQWIFSRGVTAKRQLRRVPRVLIDQFPEGAVGKVVGRLAYVGEPLVSPLTGRRCAQYRVIVEEYRSNGNSGSWHPIIEDEESQNFILKDKTGEVLVTMNGARVVVTKDAQYRSGTFNDATPSLESFLVKHRYQSTGWIFNKSLRYEEGVLAEGEEVTICGMGRWENTPEPVTPSTTGGSRDQRPRRLVIRNADQAPLYVSDDYGVLG